MLGAEGGEGLHSCKATLAPTAAPALTRVSGNAGTSAWVAAATGRTPDTVARPTDPRSPLPRRTRCRPSRAVQASAVVEASAAVIVPLNPYPAQFIVTSMISVFNPSVGAGASRQVAAGCAQRPSAHSMAFTALFTV